MKEAGKAAEAGGARPLRNQPGKPPYKFQTSYRKSNCCGKFFYCYSRHVSNRILKDGGKLKLEAVEDIKADENETEDMSNTFMKHLNERMERLARQKEAKSQN